MGNKRPDAVGRGANIRPVNRFSRQKAVELEMVEPDADELADRRHPDTRFLSDDTKSVISENASPDVGFRYSLNPYRGCEHGCSYCYARPTHEYLGFDAGLGFETRILVKHDAPVLFRRFLSKPSWTVETVALSGVTDPYQPCEREYRITRRCLEVANACNQPMGVVTKNALILRDLDLLGPMAARGLVHVNVSVTTLDPALCRAMEPRASAPAARLRAVRELSAAGVPVRVLVAPVVPGLTDHEMPSILAAVKDAGAQAAAYILLRLPLAVAPVFVDWLERAVADRKDKVLARIRDVRGGKLNESAFGRRMMGQGEFADQVRAMFRVFAKRYGLDGDLPPYDSSQFRPPPDERGQLYLF